MVVMAIAVLALGNGVMAVACDSSTPDVKFSLSLKGKQGNTYHEGAKKLTTNQHSYVKCTGLENTTKATFWINNKTAQISNDIISGISDYFGVMYYRANEYETKGRHVKLGVENYYDTSKTGKAHGYVDYE